ncbi:MAG: GAF domain-containing sensor histidine kinase [Actinomycetota bacterium]|nr:GAF domain-containing sensor histidine kinase [Actinomycetota bacterium]
MAARAEGGRSGATSALWGATLLVGLVGAVLTVVGWTDLAPTDSYLTLFTPIAALVYATLGVLVVRRAQNRIGWVLLGFGLGLTILVLTSLYAVVGVITHPGSVPAPKVVGELSEWIFVPLVFALPYLLLIFPTGELPSHRWRPIEWVVVGGTALALVGFLVTPRQVALPAPGGVSLTYSNPLAIRSLSTAASTLLLGTLPSISILTVLLLVAALVALVVRFRSGGPDLRQQIKWVAYAAVAFLLFQGVLSLAPVICDCSDSPITVAAGIASGLIVLLGIPIAITVAVLRHGLYEIDIIINRTVVYGLLASAVTAVYFLVVVGIGSLVGYGVGNPVLTTGAAVAIALAFQPLRRQAQRVANRLVYGERATPYQVLSEFADNMRGTLDLDSILQRMASVLADGTGAARVDVWVRVGAELRPAATWPQSAAPPAALAVGRTEELPSFGDVTRAIEVRQGDELLGALALQKPANETLSPTEDKLLQDLASQAGLVLRNVRLTAELRANIDELRASRRRLVGAQDEERRKIERNLHDGAQQQLVALRVQLGLLGRVAGDPERVEKMAHQLQDALQDALDDLRDLARGIYPPLLADKGLAFALEAQARKLASDAAVESDGVGRYPQEVEAAVYFCALEAMQNVSKYAEATTTVVRLAETDGHLLFEIQDDGRGFSPNETGHGTGLRGMADRLDAIGGNLEVSSEPGRGTLVRGRIKLARTT